jgi:hypothetical protein
VPTSTPPTGTFKFRIKALYGTVSSTLKDITIY